MTDARTLATDKGRIAYWTSRLDETAPWLVFLPGLTADHRLFAHQMEYFATRANCLVWDAPAHNESRPFELDFTLDDWAGWLHEILEQEGITSPILVGQSMGAYVSQAFMERYPGEVRGFVSIDSAPLQRHYYQAWELACLKHTYLMYLSIPWKLLVDWGAIGTAKSDYGRALMRDMERTYGKQEFCALAAYGYRMLAQAVEKDLPYAIDCPFMLICGKQDAAGSTRRYNRAWEAETGQPVVWIDQAGHNSNTDQPERINELLEGFVTKLVGRPL